MNNKFDELTKSLAQSVTRRAALRKFGAGVVAAIVASLGVGKSSAAPRYSGYCQAVYNGFTDGYTGRCVAPSTCQSASNSYCAGLGPGIGSRIGSRLSADPCSPGFCLDTYQKCS